MADEGRGDAHQPVRDARLGHQLAQAVQIHVAHVHAHLAVGAEVGFLAVDGHVGEHAAVEHAVVVVVRCGGVRVVLVRIEDGVHVRVLVIENVVGEAVDQP